MNIFLFLFIYFSGRQNKIAGLAQKKTGSVLLVVTQVFLFF